MANALATVKAVCYYCGDDDKEELTLNYTGETVCFSCSEIHEPCRSCRRAPCDCDRQYDEWKDREYDEHDHYDPFG